MFASSGEALTKRLRSKTFQAILRQDIAFFDQPEHSSGALCTYLATEASAVQGASGVRLGVLLQNFVTVGAGILIGFIFSWQLTLLIVAFMPLIVFGAVLQVRLITSFAKKDEEFLESAGKVITQANWSSTPGQEDIAGRGRNHTKHSNGHAAIQRDAFLRGIHQAHRHCLPVLRRTEAITTERNGCPSCVEHRTDGFSSSAFCTRRPAPCSSSPWPL